MEALAWLALEADNPELILALAHHSRLVTLAEIQGKTDKGDTGTAANKEEQESLLLWQFGAAVGVPLGQGHPTFLLLGGSCPA